MTRSRYIVMWLLATTLLSAIGYYSVAQQLGSGSLVEALLAPSSIISIMFASWALAQIWRLLTAERRERVLDPQFAMDVGRSLLVRIVGGMLCLGVGTVGALRLWRSDLLPGDPGPLTTNLFFAGYGALGALAAVTSPQMRLKLSPDGLEYSLLRTPLVSWNDVTDVKLRKRLTGPWVELTLKDTAEYRAAGPFGRWRKVTKLQLIPLAFGLEPDVLYRGIEARRSVFTF